MNKTIFKYKLKIEGLQAVTMPAGAKILSVQIQNGLPCAWALINCDEKETCDKHIETYGTGRYIRYDLGISREFISTYQVGNLVFHVFEYTGL